MQIIKFNSFITLILVLFLFFTQANGENKKISNGKHVINLYGGVLNKKQVYLVFNTRMKLYKEVHF